MIEIDSSLLSQSNLDGLFSKIIDQQATYDGVDKQSVEARKRQSLQKIQQGLCVIVYDVKELGHQSNQVLEVSQLLEQFVTSWDRENPVFTMCPRCPKCPQ